MIGILRLAQPTKLDHPDSLISASWPCSSEECTTIRCQIYPNPNYTAEQIVLLLTHKYCLSLREINQYAQAYLDLEIAGNLLQLQAALGELEKTNIKIVGKSNFYGDSWTC